MNKDLLQRCEDEVLNRSGAIQPHGALLILDASGRVSHASANVGERLGRPPEAWLGQRLPEPFAALAAMVPDAPGSRQVVELIPGPGIPRQDVTITRGPEGALNLEFVPTTTAIPPCPAPTAPPHPPRDTPGGSDPLSAERQMLVENIAELTGFERVLFYGFLADGDGEVLNETRQGQAYGSYLGLRFPASDIPHIARALYLKNPWRLIPDASASPIPILGRSEAPDLTWSDLRSVSPVHCVYLANMGVAASLSFPVICAGELTALVSAHHSRPSIPSHGAMEKGAALVRAYAFNHASHRSRQRMRMLDGLAHRFGDMQDMLRRHGDLTSAWPELGAWLCREFHVDGATLCHGDTATSIGAGFEVTALNTLDAWFVAGINDLVWAGDSLARQVPDYPLSEMAGAIAIRLGHPDGRTLRVYLGRLEHIHEVAWGGNPSKPVEYHDGELGIAPRRSFEKWVERRLGYCRPWDNETRLLALRLREMLLAALHP